MTGYKLGNGTCSILDDYKTGCNLYNTTSGNECLNCEAGFVLASGICTMRTI